MRRRLLVTAALVATLALPATADARGGNYIFDGGTARQHLEVKRALEASAFPWSVVPGRVTIHIARGTATRALPGHVWLDADLLAAKEFAWAIVQDEYAHQVDFFLFDEQTRAALNAELGGSDWCYGAAGLAHGAYGCERFASTLVWSYWQSPKNAYRPLSAADESAAMPPAQFRALLGRILGI